MTTVKRRILSATVGISIAVLLALAALLTLRIVSRSEASRLPIDAGPTPAVVGDLPVLFDVPHFGYPDQDGKLVTEHDLKGAVWICDFIYTRCTTACPVLTARMTLLQHSIRNPAIKFVSFTVDPSYDNPAVLKAYAREWHGDETRWRLLATGTDDAVHATASAMHLAVQHVNDPNNPILHSNRFVLFDSSGLARGIYDSTDSDAMTQLVKDANTLAGSDHTELLASASGSDAADAISSGASGGHQLFMIMGCAACHTRPAVAPPLEGVAGSQVHLSDGRTVLAGDAYLRESIVDPNAKIVAGYSPVMPSYRDHLSDAQIDGIIAYIKSIAADHSSSGNSPRFVATDPVCGMQVSAGSDTPCITYGIKTYYFCSETCRQKFQADPAKYAKP